MATRNPNRFHVYVIRLDPIVLESKKFLDANPDYRAGMDCYYVGMTACDPQVRYAQHLSGYKSCSFAKNFGVELMPERFSHCNPMNYVKAGRFERRLASRLRGKGYAVWQN